MNKLFFAVFILMLSYLPAYGAPRQQTYWAVPRENNLNPPTNNKLGTSFLKCHYSVATRQTKIEGLLVDEDPEILNKKYVLFWVLKPDTVTEQEQRDLVNPILQKAEKIYSAPGIQFNSIPGPTHENAAQLCKDLFIGSHQGFSSNLRVFNASLSPYITYTETFATWGSKIFWDIVAPTVIVSALTLSWYKVLRYY